MNALAVWKEYRLFLQGAGIKRKEFLTRAMQSGNAELFADLIKEGCVRIAAGDTLADLERTRGYVPYSIAQVIRGSQSTGLTPWRILVASVTILNIHSIPTRLRVELLSTLFGGGIIQDAGPDFILTAFNAE